MPGTIILLSGGADSAISLHWAKRRLPGPHYAITFDYGQRHRDQELEAAREIANLAEVRRCVITLPREAFGSGPESAGALVTHAMPVRVDGRGGLPTTFTPGRNLLFLTIAAAHGYGLDAWDIVVGCSQADYSGYPDCRQETLDAMQRALRLGVPNPQKGQSGILLPRPELTVHAPLMNLTKAQSVRLARELGGDCWTALAFSWTCYQPVVTVVRSPSDLSRPRSRPCGMCPACELRARGFREAGENDPGVTR